MARRRKGLAGIADYGMRGQVAGFGPDEITYGKGISSRWDSEQHIPRDRRGRRVGIVMEIGMVSPDFRFQLGRCLSADLERKRQKMLTWKIKMVIKTVAVPIICPGEDNRRDHQYSLATGPANNKL